MSKASLIDCGDWSKPVNTLVEKISIATGILYEPTRIRRKAKAEADAELIRAEAQIRITELQQRGLQRLIFEEGRKQENIESIITKALPTVSTEANPEKMDNDWISNVFDKCKNISDADMQVLWSKILAGEANHPGSFAKRTVNIVADLSKEDAEMFKHLCRFVWHIQQKRPLVYDYKDPIYSNNSIDFETLKHLDYLGLIHFVSTEHLTLRGGNLHGLVQYKDKVFLMRPTKDEHNSVGIGSVIFTSAGIQLESLCDVPALDEFPEYVKEQMKKNGIELLAIPKQGTDL